MCGTEGSVPPVVAEMLAGYRALLAERGVAFDWGEEGQSLPAKALVSFIGWCEPERLMDNWSELRQEMSQEKESSGPAADPVRIVELIVRALPDPLPIGVALAGPAGLKVRDRCHS